MKTKITMAEYSPELLSEWSDKNGELRPYDVTYGSNRKVWWKGGCGHEWQARIKNRTRGAGCPFCSGNIRIKGYNDLKSTYPRLMNEWSDSNTINPGDVAPYSNRKAYWKCSVCNGEWQARISDRASGSGCPYCAGCAVLKGYNDLSTVSPRLADEWSKSNELTPSQVTAHSGKKVLWRCRVCGNEWRAVVADRMGGNGCPYCFKKRLNERRMYREKSKAKRSERITIRGAKEGFMKSIPRLAVGFYAERNGIMYFQMDDTCIGLPLMAWFPEKNGAIEVSCLYIRRDHVSIPDKVKDDLCRKSGIRLVRIINSTEPVHEDCICIRCPFGSNEILSAVLSKAFEILGYRLDIDIERDMEQLKEYYRTGRADMVLAADEKEHGRGHYSE